MGKNRFHAFSHNKKNQRNKKLGAGYLGEKVQIETHIAYNRERRIYLPFDKLSTK